MDVYLIPVGPDAFECYYEAPEQEEADEPAEGQGFFARMKARFNEQLKDAIDPNGIISPGRAGVWPAAFRSMRGAMRS